MFALSNIDHHYNNQSVLQVTELSAEQGDHWLILGNSGSGKSTLLHILGGILTPSSGEVSIAGRNLHSLSGSALDRFRGQHIGIVFQQLHLISSLRVEENLLLAQYMAAEKQDRKHIAAVLGSLGIADKAHAYPDELSYGQQQRVAIARAVINNPKLILADEPTSALDDTYATQVLSLLRRQAEEHRATLVIATHDQRIKSDFANRLELGANSKQEAAN